MNRNAWTSVLLFALFSTLILSGCDDDLAMVVRNDSFRISISEQGEVVRLQDWTNGNDYLSRPSPLLQLRKNGEYVSPINAVKAGDGLDLTFPGDYVAHITIVEKETHITFELTNLTNPDSVDLVLWGPFANTINESIGETIGIARGPEFALGLQALNIKTLGGYPWNENDAMPEMDIFEGSDFHDIDPSKSRSVLYRVEAAKPDSMGSTFQAYTRNRSRARVIENQGYERFVAPPYDDGGVIGSKIALFGVPVDKTLETIGAIELAEGLPHPMIDGEWGKTSRTANAAYIIMNFSEETLDEALNITDKAGLRYLYHDDPFETWGHFKLNTTSFPDGAASVKRITDRAAARGIMVGTHNLSNFITPNDPYVTPLPDARLAKVGTTVLEADLAASDTELILKDPGFFNQNRKSYLVAAQLGTEIITFESVSTTAPWTLFGVERGAFGTTPAAHTAGTPISKLDDHGYKVFLSETDLSVEMATRLATLYNETGLRQISFDGLEGNRSTGMGNYGESLFAQAWYDNLNDDIRSHYIADASRTTHFFWHMYTRMNWGEPWYAGFRESQTEYRLKNQAYFQRNLMPGMLGWFKMTAETSVEDIEWMLSLSAGYDAGYGFVTSFDAVRENGASDAIFSMMDAWEQVRLANALSDEIKTRLRARTEEFHLDLMENGAWEITPVSVHIFRRFERERQPGEPEESLFQFTTDTASTDVSLILTAESGSVSGFRLTMGNNPELSWSGTLERGQSFVYNGGTSARIVSSSWHEIQEIEVNPASFGLGSGTHAVSFLADIEGENEAAARLEIRVGKEKLSGVLQ